MKKIVITTNIPSPYRVDLYHYLQTHLPEYHFDIIYSAKNMSNREWGVEEEKLGNAHFLHSKTFEKEEALDRHVTHVSNETGRLLTELDPDVVIAMEYNPVALQCALWCKRHHKPLIHLTDGTVYSERNISIIQKLSRAYIFHRADACIASSTKAKEKCIQWGFPTEKIFISLLTEDLSRYLVAERTPKPGQILYVGSLIKRKGIDLLFDALSKMRQPYELRIVGNGTKDECEELMNLAKKLQIDSKVHFVGFQQGEALLAEYRDADLFVLPTREDCFGLVLLEAAAAGVPIITSKYADGAYDILPNDQWMVDPENAETFARTMKSLLQNTGEKQRYSKRLRENVTKFDFATTVQGYCDAIESVTATGI